MKPVILARFVNRFAFSLLLSVLIALSGTSATLAAAGDPDPTFAASAYGTTNGTINAVKKQPDGKILIGGYFSEANGVAATGIARINSDGSNDTSFNTQNLLTALGFGASVRAIAVQTDGKILVGGYFFSSVGTAQPGLRRLNADGSSDSSFTPLIFTFLPSIADIEIQTDSKILVGGQFSGPNGNQTIVRLNSNGTFDNSFSFNSLPVKDMEIQSDGNIIVGLGDSSGTVQRLTANGTIDNTFASITANGKVEAVKIKPNGQILIGGFFTSVNGFTLGKIALVNSDGSLDLTFNQNNPGASGGGGVSIYDIELRTDGRIVIGGRFSTFNGVSRKNLAQLNTDGLLDTTFQDNSVLINTTDISDLEIQSDGKVVIGMTFSDFPLTVRRFNADGSLDSGFSPFFAQAGRVRKVLQQSDGKIIIGGDFPYVNGIKRNGLARLNTDGSVDAGFVPYFNNQFPRAINSFAVQSDGKILIGTPSVDQIFRLNTDGTQDTTFSTLFFGTPNDIVVLADGKILASFATGLRRFNSNGTIDTTFTISVGSVNKILIQPDGKVLVGGAFTQVGATVRGRIARLNADGTLDPTFNPPGGANGNVEDLDLQTDGKIILGGDFTALNGSNRLRIGRLFSDGTLDSSFNQSSDGTVRAVKVQPDGKILIGGSMGFVQSESHVGLARLNSNGAIDNTFTARPNTSVYDVILQADNKILICGEFILVNGFSAVRVVRLLNNIAAPKTPFDYDGDGKSDVSVYRPSTGVWYILRSSDFGVTQTAFAIPADIPAPADFDGDGKTDIAIYRGSNGNWWSLSSINGAQINAQWGQLGDIPLPSDFDGDGRADYVVFRPTTNQWLRASSVNGAQSNKVFGQAGDKPVIGDFDGDGKSDVAIYRPSDGNWWWQSSVDNSQRAVRWGISTDIPSTGDFDGDGKTDFAVYRPSTGVWYILNSSNLSATIVPFGLSGDKPVAADFDGDGKADIAVFRPSDGIWYLLRSTSGFAGYQFGISIDLPTQNAFVP